LFEKKTYYGDLGLVRQRLLSLEPVTVQEIADTARLEVNADEAVQAVRLQDARNLKHRFCREARIERFSEEREGVQFYLASEVMTPIERQKADRKEFRTVISHLKRLLILRSGDSQRLMFAGNAIRDIFDELAQVFGESGEEAG
jgi:hypothetical protein